MSHHCLFASNEVERLLTANGLTDLDAAFRLGEPLSGMHEVRASRHQVKRVVRCVLNDATSQADVYIKRQWRRTRWIPRPADIRRGIGLKCSPIHEWQGLRILQDAGLNVAEPLALFWQGWGFSRGAVVTRAVPARWSIADMLLGGDLQQMASERLGSLIEAAVDVVARLRRARLSWRSMKAKHFYPEEMANGQWRIWLIDCEGVYPGATERDCRRDWRRYLGYISARSPSLRDAFLSAYGLATGT
ncbi:MAG TPA: lipopolysaccharide kinase InaA family protein [Lacipirellulaceae bacterium]